ncbi:hypothetical protein D3C85_1156560 [compost metagenome]
MSDFFFADVFGMDTQVRIYAAGEVAKQAFDGRDRAVGIVADADGQGLRGDAGKGQLPGGFADCAAAGAFLVAGSGEAPVTDHAGGCVFQPAKALARKVAAQHRHQRHHHMPLAEHPPAMSGRIVAPVGELRTDRHQAPDQVPGRPQARCTAAKAVADHIDRLLWELTLCALEHRLEIQRSPIGPRGLKTLERCRPRLADAAVVIGDDIEAVDEQVVGEARVVATTDRGGGIDDHDRTSGVPRRVSPGEATEDKAVCSGFLERFTGRNALQWQLDLSWDE